MRILKIHALLKILNSYLIDSAQPANISYLWNFGSLLGLCLVIQIITGVTLAMHYNANIIEAFDSVEHVMRDVNNGWFLRYLHSNTASAFFFIVYLHIGRGLYYGSYRAPRTLVWTIGTIIFILMMATAFLGYVLPYGQMSLWGATVITNLMSAIPWIGQDIVEFIWGGFSVNNATLNRFFALHYVLPFVLAALAITHLIALHDSAGSGNPVGVTGNLDRLPFAPYFIFKDLITIYIFIIILSMFVFFMPNALGDSENYVMANPMQTPPAIVPEWYLLPFYAILRSIPNKLLGVIAMFLAILILLALPFTDLSRLRGIQFKPLSKITFFIFLANFLILMKLGAKHVESPFIEFGQISTIIFFSYFLILIPFFSLFENSLFELSSFKYKFLFPNIKNQKYDYVSLIGLFAYIVLYILSFFLNWILVYFGIYDTFYYTCSLYFCVDEANDSRSKVVLREKKRVAAENENVVKFAQRSKPREKNKKQRLQEARQHVYGLVKSHDIEAKKVMNYYCKAIVNHRIALSMEAGFSKAQGFSFIKAETKWRKLINQQVTPHDMLHKIKKYKWKGRTSFRKAVKHSDKEIRLIRQFVHAQQSMAKAGAKDFPVVPHCPFPYYITDKFERSESETERNLINQENTGTNVAENTNVPKNANARKKANAPENTNVSKNANARKNVNAPKNTNVSKNSNVSENTELPKEQPKKSRIWKKPESPERVIVNLPMITEKFIEECEKNKVYGIHLEHANNRIKVLENEIEKLKNPSYKDPVFFPYDPDRVEHYSTIPEGLYCEPIKFGKKPVKLAAFEPNRFFVTEENNEGGVINSIRANPANVAPNSTVIDYSTNTILQDKIHEPRSDIPKYDPFIRTSNLQSSSYWADRYSSTGPELQQPTLFSPQPSNYTYRHPAKLPSINSNVSDNDAMDISSVNNNPSGMLPPINSFLSNNDAMDISSVNNNPSGMLPSINSFLSNNDAMNISSVNDNLSNKLPPINSNISENNNPVFGLREELSHLHISHANRTPNDLVVKENDNIRPTANLRKLYKAKTSSDDSSGSESKIFKKKGFNMNIHTKSLAKKQDYNRAWDLLHRSNVTDFTSTIKKFGPWSLAEEERLREYPYVPEINVPKIRISDLTESNPIESNPTIEQTTEVGKLNPSSAQRKRKRAANISTTTREITGLRESNSSKSRNLKNRIVTTEASSSVINTGGVNKPKYFASTSDTRTLIPTQASTSRSDTRTLVGTNNSPSRPEFIRSSSSEERYRESFYSRD